jgi:hypothetical protein
MRPENSEARLDDPNDGLVSALRKALQPEPLPATLADRIRADWHSRSAAGRRLRLGPWQMVGAAAAAAVLLAVLLQGDLAGRTSQPAAVALSPDEAAAIVTAFGTLVWESPTDYSLDVVNASLVDIAGALRRETDSATLLPWGSDDDWDVAPAVEDDTPHSRMLPRGLVSVRSDRGSHI